MCSARMWEKRRCVYDEQTTVYRTKTFVARIALRSGKVTSLRGVAH
jgi:hypothetical protein